MGLADQVNKDMVQAMKAKEKEKLEALRAIKSALLLAATEKGAKDSSDGAEIALLQKLVKQRKEAAAIFTEQGRDDLAAAELDQVKVIEVYLPEQLGEEDLNKIVQEVINAAGASSMADMGKVMGLVNQKVAGRADGGAIARIVKENLSK